MSSVFESFSDRDWCIPLTEPSFSVISSYVIKSMDYVCKYKWAGRRYVEGTLECLTEELVEPLIG